VADSYKADASGNNFLFELLDVKSIGVVPGGSDMMPRIIRMTPALDNADHIRCIVDNNPKVPSRIKATIEGDGEDPGPCMAEMDRRLASWGADFLKLEELHAQMEALPQNHYQLDRQFHQFICAASKLPHLFNIDQVLAQSVESVLNIYRREKDHCMRFNAQHRAIIDALKSKDPQQVKKTFEINIKSGLEVIKDTYSKLLKVPFEKAPRL